MTALYNGWDQLEVAAHVLGLKQDGLLPRVFADQLLEQRQDIMQLAEALRILAGQSASGWQKSGSKKGDKGTVIYIN